KRSIPFPLLGPEKNLERIKMEPLNVPLRSNNVDNVPLLCYIGRGESRGKTKEERTFLKMDEKQVVHIIFRYPWEASDTCKVQGVQDCLTSPVPLSTFFMKIGKGGQIRILLLSAIVSMELLPVSLILVLRLSLASLMLTYGIQKLRYPASFTKNVVALLPEGHIRNAVRFVIPRAELLLGGLLLLDVVPTFIAACISVLLFVFTGTLLYGQATHAISDCGCSRKPLPVWLAIVRNVLLLCVCGLLSIKNDGLLFTATLLSAEGLVGMATLLIAVGLPGCILPKRSKTVATLETPGAYSQHRRSFLRISVLGTVALVASFLGPISSAFAYVCDCSCNVTGWYMWGPCVCGVKEYFFYEDTYCCKGGELCDEWSQGIEIAEC
ncbi:MAG: MauE/DoxX family redox-associated membrane protein, partial [Ktedonobacteraceae bacterium]